MAPTAHLVRRLLGDADTNNHNTDNSGHHNNTFLKIFVLVGILLMIAVLLYAARTWVRDRAHSRDQPSSLAHAMLGRGTGDGAWDDIQRRLNGGGPAAATSILPPLPPPAQQRRQPYALPEWAGYENFDGYLNERQERYEKDSVMNHVRSNTNRMSRAPGWAAGSNEHESARRAENGTELDDLQPRGDASPPPYEEAISANHTGSSMASPNGEDARLVGPHRPHARDMDWM